MSLIEVDGIDRDRIIDEHLVPDEYFCPVCQYLLWKPRSCSSCQHLFCEKCIQIWIGNVNSANRCPFRCEPFEDRRCPPYVQSMLNRINIHCRNSSFGCNKILSYNLLEQHENTECEYLTQQCFDCQKLVLVSKLNEHQQIPGLCIPYPIKCTICQNYISKSLFRDHFHQCCQMKIDELMDQRFQHETLQTRTHDQLQPPINGMELIQNRIDTMQMYEHQRRMSRLPTTLKGVDEVRQVRERGCGYLYHILIMFKFIFLNWQKIPFFLVMFSISGFTLIGLLIIGEYVIFSNWTYTNKWRGCFLFLLMSCLINYGTYELLQFVSDRTIIYCFALFIFLCGCAIQSSLEILEMNELFNKTMLTIITCGLGLLITKLILLFTRLYYWLMPTFLATGLLALINIYIAFKHHQYFADVMASTRNQLNTHR